MAVGDDQLGVLHAAADELHQPGNGPEAVQDFVLVAQLDVGGMARHLGQGVVDLAGGVVVQHEKLPEMRTRRPQQVEPVGLGPGMGLLVPEDHAAIVGLELAQRDETSPLQTLLRRARDGKFLGVGIEHGVGVLEEDGVLAPLGKHRRGAAIDVLAVIAGFALPQNDAHQVVRTGRVIALLHLRRDLVVRLGDDIRQPHPGGVVAQGGEGEDPGHS